MSNPRLSHDSMYSIVSVSYPPRPLKSKKRRIRKKWRKRYMGSTHALFKNIKTVFRDGYYKTTVTFAMRYSQ